MENNVIPIMKATIELDKNDIKRQTVDSIISGYKEATRIIEGDTIVYKIKGETSELKKITKEIAETNPTLKSNIVFESSKKELDKQLSSIESMVGKKGKDISKILKQNITNGLSANETVDLANLIRFEGVGKSKTEKNLIKLADSIQSKLNDISLNPEKIFDGKSFNNILKQFEVFEQFKYYLNDANDVLSLNGKQTINTEDFEKKLKTAYSKVGDFLSDGIGKDILSSAITNIKAQSDIIENNIKELVENINSIFNKGIDTNDAENDLKNINKQLDKSKDSLDKFNKSYEKYKTQLKEDFNEEAKGWRYGTFASNAIKNYNIDDPDSVAKVKALNDLLAERGIKIKDLGYMTEENAKKMSDAIQESDNYANNLNETIEGLQSRLESISSSGGNGAGGSIGGFQITSEQIDQLNNKLGDVVEKFQLLSSTMENVKTSLDDKLGISEEFENIKSINFAEILEPLKTELKSIVAEFKNELSDVSIIGEKQKNEFTDLINKLEEEFTAFQDKPIKLEGLDELSSTIKELNGVLNSSLSDNGKINIEISNLDGLKNNSSHTVETNKEIEQSANAAAQSEENLAKAEKQANENRLSSDVESQIQQNEKLEESIYEVYRAYNKMSGIKGEKDISWFSTDFETMMTYLKEHPDRELIKGNLDFSKLLNIDANGALHNNITYLGDDSDEASVKITKLYNKIQELKNSLSQTPNDALQQELHELELEYDKISEDTSNLYGTHTTNWFAIEAQKAGYLGIAIRNVIDDYNGLIDKPSTTIALFDIEQLENQKRITDEVRGSIEQVQQVAFDTKKAIGEDVINFVDSKDISDLSDELREVEEFNSLMKLTEMTAEELGNSLREVFAYAHENPDVLSNLYDYDSRLVDVFDESTNIGKYFKSMIDSTDFGVDENQLEGIYTDIASKLQEYEQEYINQVISKLHSTLSFNKNDNLTDNSSTVDNLQEEKKEKNIVSKSVIQKPNNSNNLIPPNENIPKEEKQLEELTQEIKSDVIPAIDAKTTAFTNEKVAVGYAVDYEIEKLKKLVEKINTVEEAVKDLAGQKFELDITLPDKVSNEQTTTAFNNLKESLKGNWTKNLEDISNILQTLTVEDSVSRNIQNLANAILNLKSNLNNLSTGGSTFLASINELVSNENALKDLASVLKATQAKIKETKDAINKENVDKPKTKTQLSTEYYGAVIAKQKEVLKLTKQLQSPDKIVRENASILIDKYNNETDLLLKEISTQKLNNKSKQAALEIIQDQISKEEMLNEIREGKRLEREDYISNNTVDFKELGVAIDELTGYEDEWSKALKAAYDYRSILGDVVDIQRNIRKQGNDYFESYVITGKDGNKLTRGKDGTYLMSTQKVSSELTDKTTKEREELKKVNETYQEIIASLNKVNSLKKGLLSEDDETRAITEAQIKNFQTRASSRIKGLRDNDLWKLLSNKQKQSINDAYFEISKTNVRNKNKKKNKKQSNEVDSTLVSAYNDAEKNLEYDKARNKEIELAEKARQEGIKQQQDLIDARKSEEENYTKWWIRELQKRDIEERKKSKTTPKELKDATDWLMKNEEEYRKLSTKKETQIGLTDKEIQKLKELDAERSKNRDILDSYAKTLDEAKESQKAYNTLSESISTRITPDSLYKSSISEMIEDLKKLDTARYTDDFRASVNALITDLGKLDVESDTFEKGFVDIIERFNSIDGSSNNLSNIESTYLNLEKYQSKIAKNLADNTKMSDELRNKFESLSATIKEMQNSGQFTDEQVKKIRKDFQELNTEMIRTGQTGRSMFDSIANRIKQMSTNWISMYFSMYDIVRYARQVASTVTEIDTAITELRKVSNATDSRLDASYQKSAKTAKELGSTITDVINSTSDWARLGYNVDAAEELARVTTLYQNVGDGIDQTSASESLISTMQGFQLAYTDAEQIIDRFNEVSNNFAISSGGIGEALQRSAASFNAANTDLSKSIALITAANTIVQDPEKVGTAFTTLSARIRGSKSELEELGEETDTYVESTSKLRKTVKGISGVDIMQDENTYKDIYTILLEISKVWDNIKDVDRASLLESLAGKRQSNIIAGILSDSELLEQVYNTAENSAGSAMKEQQNFEKSIQYSINTFKASVQDWSNSMIDSGVVKFLVDAGTGVVNLSKSVGALGSALSVAAGAASLFKNVGRDKSIPSNEYADGVIICYGYISLYNT